MTIFITEIARDNNGEPILDEGFNESITSRHEKVKFVVNNKEDYGSGTLYITTVKLIWSSDSDDQLIYGLLYDKIVLHAISKDKSLYKDSCVFIQLDDGFHEDGNVPTLILAPENEAEVEAVFNNITSMFTLYDELNYQDDDDGEDEEGGDVLEEDECADEELINYL